MQKIATILGLLISLGSVAKADISPVQASSAGMYKDGYETPILLSEAKGVASILGCSTKNWNIRGPVLKVRAHFNLKIPQSRVTLFQKEYSSNEECENNRTSIMAAINAGQTVNMTFSYKGANEAGLFDIQK